MNSQTASMMQIPSPCGLAVTSVTGDGTYLYALQPDRKTVYKMDVCGRILCSIRLAKKYTALFRCGNRIFAAAEGERTRIFVLNRCFAETGSFEPDFPRDAVRTAPDAGIGFETTLFFGPSGSCETVRQDTMFSLATLSESFTATADGRLMGRLGTAGRNRFYTAIAENDGIVYEGLESTFSPQTYIRATLRTSGASKVQRLPYGWRVRSFFCDHGRLYAFLTKNSYHGYIAAVCTYAQKDALFGEILNLPDSPYDTEGCCEESCAGSRFGARHSACGCGASCGNSVSTNQTELCGGTAVSGDSTGTDECDVDELCRLYGCLKRLCGNGSSVAGEASGNAGCSGCGTLACTCTQYPNCRCDDVEADREEGSCLPLPPCTGTADDGISCGGENLSVTYRSVKNGSA